MSNGKPTDSGTIKRVREAAHRKSPLWDAGLFGVIVLLALVLVSLNASNVDETEAKFVLQFATILAAVWFGKRKLEQ